MDVRTNLVGVGSPAPSISGFGDVTISGTYTGNQFSVLFGTCTSITATNGSVGFTSNSNNTQLLGFVSSATVVLNNTADGEIGIRFTDANYDRILGFQGGQLYIVKPPFGSSAVYVPVYTGDSPPPLNYTAIALQSMRF